VSLVLLATASLAVADASTATPDDEPATALLLRRRASRSARAAAIPSVRCKDAQVHPPPPPSPSPPQRCKGRCSSGAPRARRLGEEGGGRTSKQQSSGCTVVANRSFVRRLVAPTSTGRPSSASSSVGSTLRRRRTPRPALKPSSGPPTYPSPTSTCPAPSPAGSRWTRATAVSCSGPAPQRHCCAGEAVCSGGA